MRVWRVLLASVAVHGLVLGIVALEWDAWIPPVVTIPVTPHVDVVDVSVQSPVQTIDVAMIDDAPVTAKPARAGVAATRRAIATASGGGTATTTAEPEGKGTGKGKGKLSMRGPDLRPADDVMERIADAPGHEPPPPPISSKRLDDAGRGSVIHDRVTTIKVEADGTAHLHDEPDIDAHFDANPVHIIRGIKDFGRSIADWADDPDAGKRYGTTQDLPKHLQAVEGECDHFGSQMCDDPSAPGALKDGPKQTDQGVELPILHGKLDITGYLMKKFGVGDAYASRKLKALDDTRLERAERGSKFKAEQLAKSALLMQDNLQRLWSTTRDLDERKAVLFELWDECAEGEGPTGDAGDRARVMVIGWIHANVPEGKPGEFTAKEIDALDRKRSSKQHFAPY